MRLLSKANFFFVHDFMAKTLSENKSKKETLNTRNINEISIYKYILYIYSKRNLDCSFRSKEKAGLL